MIDNGLELTECIASINFILQKHIAKYSFKDPATLQVQLSEEINRTIDSILIGNSTLDKDKIKAEISTLIEKTDIYNLARKKLLFNSLQKQYCSPRKHATKRKTVNPQSPLEGRRSLGTRSFNYLPGFSQGFSDFGRGGVGFSFGGPFKSKLSQSETPAPNNYRPSYTATDCKQPGTVLRTSVKGRHGYIDGLARSPGPAHYTPTKFFLAK